MINLLFMYLVCLCARLHSLSTCTSVRPHFIVVTTILHVFPNSDILYPLIYVLCFMCRKKNYLHVSVVTINHASSSKKAYSLIAKLPNVPAIPYVASVLSIDLTQ